MSIYELLGNKAMFLHLWPHSYPFRLSSRQIPETVLVQATRIIFGASIGELLTYDWKTLDLRLWLLEDLKDVVLVFRSSGGSKPSRDQKYVREIAAKMPLVCRRCSLQFMIGSTAVPWDVLSEEADLEDGNLRDTQGEVDYIDVDFNGILEDEFIEGLMSGKLSP